MAKEAKEQQNKEFLTQDNHRVNFEGNCIFWKESPILSLFDSNHLSKLLLLPNSELVQFQDLTFEKR